MATPKRSALGRGLDALISMDNIVTSGTSSIHEIELSQIVPNPDQPRREFDQEALEELASSSSSLGSSGWYTLKNIGWKMVATYYVAPVLL